VTEATIRLKAWSAADLAAAAHQPLETIRDLLEEWVALGDWTVVESAGARYYVSSPLVAKR
jgi:phosphoserine phosphatase